MPRHLDLVQDVQHPAGSPAIVTAVTLCYERHTEVSSMSETPEPHDRPARHVSDGTWGAHYVLTGQDQMALVIEQDTPGGKTVTSMPLTPPRARELRRLLREMLEAAGERVMPDVTPIR